MVLYKSKIKSIVIVNCLLTKKCNTKDNNITKTLKVMVPTGQMDIRTCYIAVTGFQLRGNIWIIPDLHINHFMV